MKLLKEYLYSIGTGDENYYLGQVMHVLYKDYQRYYFYFDIDNQTPLEAVESVLENQLKGEIGLEDVHWVINSITGDDCICLYNFTKEVGTEPSFLHQTVELTERLENTYRGLNDYK